MNEKSNKGIVIAVIIVIILIAVLVWANKSKTAVPSTNDATATVTPSTSQSNSAVKTSPARTPIPADTLVLLSPVGGEKFNKDQVVKISWDSSVDLTSAKIIITLWKDGKELSVLSEKGGVTATAKEFNWKLPDVSVWGEEGFSIQIQTSGLVKNLKAQSGAFNAS